MTTRFQRSARVSLVVEFPIDDPSDWESTPTDSDRRMAANVKRVLDENPDQIMFLISEHSSTTAVEVTTVKPPREEATLAVADAFEQLADEGVAAPKLAEILAGFPENEHDIVRIEVMFMLDSGQVKMNHDRSLSLTAGGAA